MGEPARTRTPAPVPSTPQLVPPLRSDPRLRPFIERLADMLLADLIENPPPKR